MKGGEQKSFCGGGSFDHQLPNPAGHEHEAQSRGLNQPQGASPGLGTLIRRENRG